MNAPKLVIGERPCLHVIASSSPTARRRAVRYARWCASGRNTRSIDDLPLTSIPRRLVLDTATARRYGCDVYYCVADTPAPGCAIPPAVSGTNAAGSASFVMWPQTPACRFVHQLSDGVGVDTWRMKVIPARYPTCGPVAAEDLVP